MASSFRRDWWLVEVEQDAGKLTTGSNQMDEAGGSRSTGGRNWGLAVDSVEEELDLGSRR